MVTWPLYLSAPHSITEYRDEMILTNVHYKNKGPKSEVSQINLHWCDIYFLQSPQNESCTSLDTLKLTSTCQHVTCIISKFDPKILAKIGIKKHRRGSIDREDTWGHLRNESNCPEVSGRSGVFQGLRIGLLHWRINYSSSWPEISMNLQF